MANLSSPSAEILKKAILEIDEPVLFQHMLRDEKDVYNWKLLRWNLNELAEKFGDIKLPFRVGYNVQSTNPQWESNCPIVTMTLSEFIQKDFNTDKKRWYYFDYKYMEEWFKENPEIMNSLNWKRFGFDIAGSDSTLWIGSKGAHTNCHQDSYGCNLVAQIHGRKQWLLFPPNASNFLESTRVPYEESTIYSKYNFFCPTKEVEMTILKMQNKPRLITLEPGDVLFVPPGWWHYVESLDLTISVNMWLPITIDNVSRVKEAIVKLIVTRIGKNVCHTPDEGYCSLPYCLKLLSIALGECKNIDKEELICKKTKYDTWTAKNLATQYPNNVKLLNEIDASTLEEFLRTKRERCLVDNIESPEDKSSEINTETQDDSLLNNLFSEKIVNALCHPDVINKVTELLLSS